MDRYSDQSNYQTLSYEDTLLVKAELAPLILPDGDEVSAVRFDALMYGIELAYLAGKKYGKARSDLLKKVRAISNVANIPEIMVQAELINKILHADYLDNAGINEFEYIRENLRDLMKYLPDQGTRRYDTNFEDDILSIEWKESELENDDLKNYKAKAEYYVREIVGLDMNAAKEAFSEYLNEANLDSRQIFFVNQIVEYIVHNGLMKDLSVLQESPFTDQGSVVDIFTDLNVWMGIRKVIDEINANAMTA